MALTIGLKGSTERREVTKEFCASSAGSGNLDVFATPYMIALMEMAASESVLPELENGKSSVGTRLDISHIAATPIGMKVWAESELVEIDGKRLVFKIAAYDESGLIGEGTHERFVIDIMRFLEKTQSKLSKH